MQAMWHQHADIKGGGGKHPPGVSAHSSAGHCTADHRQQGSGRGSSGTAARLLAHTAVPGLPSPLIGTASPQTNLSTPAMPMQELLV